MWGVLALVVDDVRDIDLCHCISCISSPCLLTEDCGVADRIRQAFLSWGRGPGRECHLGDEICSNVGYMVLEN